MRGKRELKLAIKIAMLSVAILLVPLVLVSAESSTGTWIDYAASSFAGGDGSQQNPYQIATPEQLAYLATQANIDGGPATKDKFYKLVNNLNLSTHRWIPIGYGGFNVPGKEGIFQGYFDGNNKTITGLNINETTDCYAGLFGVAIGSIDNKQPIVQNLTIKDASIHITSATVPSTPSTETRVGILVGSIATYANNKDTSFISNVKVSGTLALNGTGTTGGMAGFCQFVTFKNCTTDITINNNNGYNGTGGFFGQCEASAAIHCTSKGNLTGNYSLGGFVGVTTLDAKITNCISQTTVYGNDWNVGGFIGYQNPDAIIESCVAYGDVTSSVATWQPKIGGFAGTNTGKINKCYAANTVTSKHPTIPAGGFLGYGDPLGVIQDSSYDAIKNPTLAGVGENGSAGTNTIKQEKSEEVLTNVCDNVYGSHDFSIAWTIDKEPSCTQEGSKSHHCTRCNSLSAITAIAKTPLTKVEAIAPTCTSEGNIEYWYCPDDSKYFRDKDALQEITLADTIQGVIAHTPHKIDAKPTSCTTKGNIAYWSCDVCGKFFSDQTMTTELTKEATEIAKLPHLAQYIQAIAPTCTQDGASAYWHCNVCDTYFSDAGLTLEISKAQTILPKVPHTAKYIEAVAATCTKEGTLAHWYCDVCHNYFSDKELTTKISKEQTILPKVAHNAQYIDFVEATCMEKGNLAHWHCNVCGTNFLDKALTVEISKELIEFDKLPHITLYTKAVEATCIKEGTRENWYCTVCHNYFSDKALTLLISKEQTVLPKVAHTAKYIEAAAATCTREGTLAHWYCDICKNYFSDKELTTKISKEQVTLPKVAHNVQYIEGVGVTCTRKGVLAHWHCDVCGTDFLDKALTIEIAKGRTEFDTLPHVAQHIKAMDPTQAINGNIEYWYCPVCDTYFADKLLTKTIQKADTVIMATGKKENTPEINTEKPQQETKKSKETTTTPETSTPDTGDTNPISTLLLMLVSTSGLITLLYTKKQLYTGKNH